MFRGAGFSFREVQAMCRQVALAASREDSGGGREEVRREGGGGHGGDRVRMGK